MNVGHILESIIRQTGYIPTNLPLPIPGETVKSHDEPFVDKTKTEKLNRQHQALESKLQLQRDDARRAAILAEKKAAEDQRIAEREALKEKIKQLIEGKIDSQVDETQFVKGPPKNIFEIIQNSIKKVFSPTSDLSEIDKIMSMSKTQQADLLAKRRKEYGFANTMRNTADTGDLTGISRTGFLWRRNQPNNQDTNPFKNIKITPGIDVDYEGINDALQSAIERNQFTAQTGGGFFKQLWGSMTMYAGQDSIEKSRAQADGLNEVMRIMKDAINDLVDAIKVEETALKGMERSGQAVFNDDGTLSDKSSNEAFVTAARMEELKLGLRGVLAEAEMTDDIVESVGGNIGEILKRLGFAAPELQKCNKVLRNINSGLDKNGKALKFQKRTQEVLNYSFQLMSRHIGQMFKNWMMQLNPITQIKKAFSDFASYDTKWQRTMNVIKYNIRRIIRPFMEWLAQQFVNIIGLANALVKGLGKAFGQNWDLFDKSAASAEKAREEMEAAANVTAGFDELHDIGGDSSDPAMDFSGDIYTPQWEGLNKVIEDFGEKVGKVFKGIKDLTEGWDFWDWLILAGAAITGFAVLKWLIGIFSGGKNPMESIAKGFKTLQTTVGWAILIWAFTEFTKALKDLVDCMKTADWDDIAKSLTTLAGGFAILVGAIILLSKMVTTDFRTLLGMAAVVAVFDAVLLSLIPFIEALKEVTSSQLMSGLIFLAGALLSVSVAVGALAIIFTAIATTGIGLAALGILAGILAIVALVILAMAELVRALGEAGGGIRLILDGIANIINALGTQITNFVNTIATAIMGIIETMANGIKTVLEPILEFIDGVMEKIFELAGVIAHEIGETIRTVIETTGNVIVGIIRELVNIIPTLLSAVLNFIRQIGPAIESSVDAIMRTITKLINFVISGIEYMINTLLIDTINKAISTITLGLYPHAFDRLDIPRFVPKYEQGTNYVPNDGLAYLHQGEAVIPKKYNQPYQPGTLSSEERAYMTQMMNTMRSLDGTMKQGITVNGQFVQRGSDLVAVVNKTKSQTGADLLSNVAYAR